MKPYGIPYARCDTIRNRVDLSLPAGRLLPFSRVETVSSEYETELIPVARDEAYEMLSELAERTLLRGAKGGKLEELSCRIREDGDLWRLDADYIMTEDS